MDKKQIINCTVSSCKYQNENNKCNLNQITVKPFKNCKTGEKDETICGDYKLDNQNIKNKNKNYKIKIKRN